MGARESCYWEGAMSLEAIQSTQNIIGVLCSLVKHLIFDNFLSAYNFLLL